MIELRKMDEADYPAYETLVTDEQVMRYITEHPLTKAEAKRRFTSIIEQQRHDRLGSYLASRLLELANEHELTVVTATIDPNHTASKKILTQLGFRSTYVGLIDGLPGEILEKRLGESS